MRAQATIICLSVALATAAGAGGADRVTVTKRDDGLVAVTAPQYAAVINPAGRLMLSVADTLVLEGGFGEWPNRVWQLWADAAAPSINVIANLVAIRSGHRRIEYTFGPAEIGIETEGYPLLFVYNPVMVKAAVGMNGTGGPLGPRVGCGNATGMILTNGQMIASSMPLNLQYQLTPRVVPSNYLNGSVKPGQRLQFTLRFQDVSMAAGIGGINVQGVGVSYDSLNRDGSTGSGLLHFPDGTKVRLETSQPNSGGEDSHDITYHLTLKDHYFEGQTVHEATQTAHIPAGGTAALRWDLPTLAPGFYYVTIAASLDDKELTRLEDVLAVDLPHYRHPLTRPADFKEFWQQKLADMRARPFREQLTELPDQQTETHKVYRLEFDGPDGQRLTGTLKVPHRPGRYMGSMCPWEPGVSLDVPFPEAATFRTWISKDKNNLLECILINRRCFDYLKSRPDVDRLFLFGGSRGGPINWVTAALDPDRIAGLSIHVPTSFGCSWLDKKYRGWGEKPPQLSWEEYTAMAAYVDPVNHAPDMVVPFINAYGDRDGLAQPQGVEVAYQLSPAQWKRMSRDRGGHTRTDGFKTLQKQFAEFLQTASPQEGDLKILKEH